MRLGRAGSDGWRSFATLTPIVPISVIGGTATRSATLYVPAKYSSTPSNVPLVLAFHGYGSNGPQQEKLSRLDLLADAHGCLVAYPDGLPVDPNEPNSGHFHWDANPGSADVKFIGDLIKTLIDIYHYKVDTTRIYATGLSNGGGMANRVGCDLASVFAAIAPVEGGYAEPGWAVCKPARSIPVITFHGTPDATVPYNGGLGTGAAAGIGFPSIPDWAAAWALRDACNATPTVALYDNDPDVTVTTYSQCGGNASVVLYSIGDNGHAWPGSFMLGASHAINANTEMWKFFTQYAAPLPPP